MSPHSMNKLVKGIALLISSLKKKLGLKKENFVSQSYSLSARGRVQVLYLPCILSPRASEHPCLLARSNSFPAGSPPPPTTTTAKHLAPHFKCSQRMLLASDPNCLSRAEVSREAESSLLSENYWILANDQDSPGR